MYFKRSPVPHTSVPWSYCSVTSAVWPGSDAGERFLRCSWCSSKCFLKKTSQRQEKPETSPNADCRSTLLPSPRALCPQRSRYGRKGSSFYCLNPSVCVHISFRCVNMYMYCKTSSHSSQLQLAGSNNPLQTGSDCGCSRSSGWLDRHRHAWPKRLVCAVVVRKVSHQVKCVRGQNEPDLLKKAPSLSPLRAAGLQHSSPAVTVAHSHTHAHSHMHTHTHTQHAVGESTVTLISCRALLFDAPGLLCMFGKWSSEVFPSPLIISQSLGFRCSFWLCARLGCWAGMKLSNMSEMNRSKGQISVLKTKPDFSLFSLALCSNASQSNFPL